MASSAAANSDNWESSPAKVKPFPEHADIWATASALLSCNFDADKAAGYLKLAPKRAERHLLVLGGKSAGKTAITSRYSEGPTEVGSSDTVGINYSFVKRQNDAGTGADVGNIWEIGSSAFMAEMLQTVSTQLDGQNVMIFVVVDISTPETLFSVLQNTLQPLHDNIQSFSDAAIWIVGTKFDRQQSLNLELDKRQAIGDALRQIAAAFSLGLLYTSQLNRLDPKIKAILDSWFLGESAPAVQPPVTDALKLIFIPPNHSDGGKRPPVTQDDCDAWKRAISAAVPQKSAVEFRSGKDPMAPPTTDLKLYAEPELDEAFAVIAAELKAKTRLALPAQNK